MKIGKNNSRSVGPAGQLQVIFRERATNYRAFLRKMTYKEKVSCASSPVHLRLCIFATLYRSARFAHICCPSPRHDGSEIAYLRLWSL